MTSLAVLAAVAAVLWFTRRRLGTPAFHLSTGMYVLAIGIWGLCVPFCRTCEQGGVVLLLLAPLNALLFLWALLASPRAVSRAVALVWNPVGRAVLLLLLSTVVPFGWAESVTRFLTDRNVLRHFTPTQTIMPPQTNDWRRATMIADELREPDPVLLWRPKRQAPYNAQGFKGELAAVPKPPDLFRIICYGDSNTEGYREAAWPERLHELLYTRAGARRTEVINAGVIGYSSYQGLMRFLEEVETYRPDLVLVSFGWNDTTIAQGPPDREFKLQPSLKVAVTRVLLRYTSYLTLMAYLPRPEVPPADAAAADGLSRVPLEDYRANLSGFLEEGRRRGIGVVYLTRPHRDPSAHMEPAWQRVPGYNDALREFARAEGAELIDAERYFERPGPSSFADVCHFTLAAHDEMAQWLATELEARTLIP